ncbi:MAG TPA: hypothetical protein VE422_30565 [Terriglobia bacterium]|nr:hypothetical protein [Terriglobia bacterium]
MDEQHITVLTHQGMLEWLADIRDDLASIDTDSRLTADDKKLIKRFYFKECLPPRIQGAVRQFFPDEFAGNERPARSKQRAKTGDHTKSDSGSTHTEGESETVTIPGDDDIQ